MQVIISGDHGYGWDYKRKYSMNSVWGFKTFYERITIPLILSKIKKSGFWYTRFDVNFGNYSRAIKYKKTFNVPWKKYF